MNKEVICRIGHNDDCIGKINQNHGNCNTYSEFEAKGIFSLGICSNPQDFYENTVNYCYNPIQIGENKYSPDKNLDKLMHVVQDSNYEGISLNQPQCEGITNNIAECQIDQIDQNAPWFCKGELDSCTYGNRPVSSCEKNPPSKFLGSSYESPLYSPNCCSPDKLSTLGDNDFCCPIKPITVGTSSKDYLCLNKSLYKPDPVWLSLSEKSCSLDEHCQTQENRKRLINSLQKNNVQSISEDEIPQFANPKEKSYSDLYCDNGQCKFFAGYIDKFDTKDHPKPQYEALWMVGNNHIDSISEAVYINKGGTFGDKIYLNNPGGTNDTLNFCKPSDGSGADVYGIYDPNTGSPIEPDRKLTYENKIQVPLFDHLGKPVVASNLQCLNYAQSLLDDSYWGEDIDSDSGSANLDNNITSGGECIFTGQCNNTNFGTEVVGKSGIEKLKWNFGPAKVSKLKNQQIKLSTGIPIKFAAKPKNISAQKNSCSALNPVSECEDIKVPSAWSGLEHNFTNVCELSITGQQCKDASASEMYLLNPSSAGGNWPQYCKKGVFLNTSGDLQCY